MAIAYDSSTASSGGSATSRTFSHTCSGSDRILFVATLSGGGDIVTGATYNSVSMTQVGKVLLGTDNELYLHYLIAPATGSNNVVVSMSGTAYIQCAATSFTGANQSSQPDASTTSYNPSTSSLTTTVTTIADNCWLVEAGRAMDTSSIGAGSGTTLRIGDYLCCMLDSNGARTPAGSQSLVFTGGASGRMGNVMASFSPSTGGSSVNSNFFALM